jgi:hypothetical protein
LHGDGKDGIMKNVVMWVVLGTAWLPGFGNAGDALTIKAKEAQITRQGTVIERTFHPGPAERSTINMVLSDGTFPRENIQSPFYTPRLG